METLGGARRVLLDASRRPLVSLSWTRGAVWANEPRTCAMAPPGAETTGRSKLALWIKITNGDLSAANKTY